MTLTSKRNRTSTRAVLQNVASFFLGCFVCTSWFINTNTMLNEPQAVFLEKPTLEKSPMLHEPKTILLEKARLETPQIVATEAQPFSKLHGVRILVAIASYNFAQLPHLEEVLDSYHDLCLTRAIVHVFVFTTVPYPVALIDLFNTRLTCEGLEIKIIIKNPQVRLNLVDFHRELFYEKIEEYDLFLYSEDDLRVTPKTVAAYIEHTKRVEQIVGKSPAEDFNVGVVRYEYNYPLNVVIDDSTRHATENVTRVYWEHVAVPIVPKAVAVVPDPLLAKKYVHTLNHHQGMFLATRELLQAWKYRPGCKFDVIRRRPGMKNRPSQPAEGTQRVWMSSHMLHGSKHCNVQQILPIEQFGQLNVLHLPNKNYRRVGKKGRLGGVDSNIENSFGTGEEKFDTPSSTAKTAMEFHLAMRKAYPVKEKQIYTGIRMIDEWGGHRELMTKRMRAYENYVARGGVMSDSDFNSWSWLPSQ